MFQQTRPWWHALTASTISGRNTREALLQACRAVLRDLAAMLFRRRGAPSSTVQRPEPPPIRWEM